LLVFCQLSSGLPETQKAGSQSDVAVDACDLTAVIVPNVGLEHGVGVQRNHRIMAGQRKILRS